MSKLLKTNLETTLEELRDSIDRIDNSIVLLLAERFAITRKIGKFKKALELPPQDKKREQQKIKKITVEAKAQKLSPKLVSVIFREIIDTVIAEHKKTKKTK